MSAEEIKNNVEPIEAEEGEEKYMTWEENAAAEYEGLCKLRGGLGKYGSKALGYIASDNCENCFLILELLSEEGAFKRYGQMIDRRAAEMQERMEKELRALPENELTDDFMKNIQILRGIQKQIEEVIFQELVYREDLIRE